MTAAVSDPATDTTVSLKGELLTESVFVHLATLSGSRQAYPSARVAIGRHVPPQPLEAASAVHARHRAAQVAARRRIRRHRQLACSNISTPWHGVQFKQCSNA